MIRIALTLLLLSFGLALPAAAQDAFAGKWLVTNAVVAPWAQPNVSYKPAADPKFAHATFVFAKDKLTAPAPFNCKAHYKVMTVEYDYLFQGGLTDPEKQAKALGFANPKILNLEFACERADADIEMDFHMADPDTVIFGLNDIVYTMKRQK